MSIDEEKPILPEEDNQSNGHNPAAPNADTSNNRSIIIHPYRSLKDEEEETTYRAEPIKEKSSASFSERVKSAFTIEVESDRAEIMDTFPKKLNFRGEKLWVLILAGFVACIGLNTDNTLMLIGAMILACPILYPILGIGFGYATNEKEIIQLSARNMLRVLGITVGVSFIYFLFSPISEPTDLINAHARPNFYNILTAILAGAIGTIMLAKPQKSYVLPALAMLSTILPPMCCIGFGLATGNIDQAVNSLYLAFSYFLFMSLSAMFTTRFLGYSKNEVIDKEQAVKLKWMVTGIAAITLIPSVLTAYHVVNEKRFDKQATAFVEENINFRNTAVIKPIHTKYDRSRSTIEVILVGEPLAEQVIESIQERMKDPKYKLEDAKLVVRQNVQNTGLPSLSSLPPKEDYINVSMIESMFKERDKIIDEQRKRLDEMQNISRTASFMGTNVSQKSLRDLTHKVGALYSNIKSIAYTEGFEVDLNNKKSANTNLFIVTTCAPISLENKEKISQFINLEVGMENMRVVFE